ncbi:MAG: hypothetical protein HW388_515 [Dehalococcoidia bacterium]|nr:hypothetical protein [Dehalococcoidia bacterium]
MPPENTPPPTAGTRKKPRYFYGWNIVAASFMAHLAYGEHYSSVLGLFFKPFKAEFGWSRTAMSAVQSIARVIEALAAPIVGPLIDRYGPRVLMPVGGIIVGLAMLAVTQMTTLWHFYLLRGGLTALGFMLIGGMVTTVAVNNWFVRKRGRALAFAGVGTNLSNVALVPIIVWLIAAHGWRSVFVLFAILTWVVVVIPSAILMRRRPEDMGLHPDGVEPTAAKVANPAGEEQTSQSRAAASTREPVWSRKEVLMTSTFWMLIGASAVDNLAFQGINISLAPYIQDLGYNDTLMAAVVTFRAAIMAISLPAMGFLAEYAHRVQIRVFPFVLLAIGSFLFLLAGKPTFLWLAVGVYGLGLTAVGMVQEVLWANFFGRLSLGMVRSTAFLVAFGFGAAGPIFMNAVFDIVGSYRPAYILFIFLFLIAGVLMAMVRPPKARRYAEPT